MGLRFLSFVVSQCSQHLSATTIVQQSQIYLSIKDLKVKMKQALLTKVKHNVQIKVKPVTQIKRSQLFDESETSIFWMGVKLFVRMELNIVVFFQKF